MQRRRGSGVVHGSMLSRKSLTHASDRLGSFPGLRFPDRREVATSPMRVQASAVQMRGWTDSGGVGTRFPA